MTKQRRATSRTALGVAAIRAMHQTIDGEPKILDDKISARLLGTDASDEIEQRARTAGGAAALDLRARVLLRSRFAEERLARAVARGVRQFVNLGAGLDTFAYRQPDWATPLRLFEVDHPASQADKRRRLAQAGIAVPDNLSYAAIDFEMTSLADGLAATSLDFAQPTFFSCLGVLVYLARDVVDALFRTVATFPAGSEIAFTFAASESSLASPTAERARAAGEPWLTTFTQDELRRDLTGLGYGTIDFLEQAEASRYLGQRSDALRPPARSSIATAIMGAQRVAPGQRV